MEELDYAFLDRDFDRIKASVFLNKSAAFFGPLMASMDFSWDTSIETAETNGVYIKWNPHFYLSLPRDARKTVLMHELRHPAYGHMLRVGGRDPELWNIACDHYINLELLSENYSFEGIEWALKDPQYKGMSCEEIYDTLQLNPPPPGGGGSFKPNDGGDMAPPNPTDLTKAAENIISAVHSARKSNQAGSIPGELQDVLNTFLKPKINWRIVLDRFFTQWEQSSWTWRRPNRRFPDIYLPSKGGSNRIESLNYYLDVSGSVTDAQVIRFNSELKHIKEKFKPKLLRLIQFDTRIQSVTEFKEDEPFDKLIVVGRGGTDLRCVRQHILDTKPTAAVIFSDMYVSPMKPVHTPTVWISIGNKAAETLFGTVIHITD